MSEQSRNEFRERQRELFVTSCRVETGKVIWAGETGAESRVGGAGSCSSWGLHSRVRVAEHRDWSLSAFSGLPLEQSASSLREILAHFPEQQLQVHWPVGQTQTLISECCLSCWVCPGTNPWGCSCRPDSIPGPSWAGLSCWCDCTSGDHNEFVVFQWLLKSLE